MRPGISACGVGPRCFWNCRWVKIDVDPDETKRSTMANRTILLSIRRFILAPAAARWSRQFARAAAVKRPLIVTDKGLPRYRRARRVSGDGLWMLSLRWKRLPASPAILNGSGK